MDILAIMMSIATCIFLIVRTAMYWNMNKLFVNYDYKKEEELLKNHFPMAYKIHTEGHSYLTTHQESEYWSNCKDVIHSILKYNQIIKQDTIYMDFANKTAFIATLMVFTTIVLNELSGINHSHPVIGEKGVFQFIFAMAVLVGLIFYFCTKNSTSNDLKENSREEALRVPTIECYYKGVRYDSSEFRFVFGECYDNVLELTEKYAPDVFKFIEQCYLYTQKYNTTLDVFGSFISALTTAELPNYGYYDTRYADDEDETLYEPDIAISKWEYEHSEQLQAYYLRGELMF